MIDKATMRKKLRKQRRDHAAAIPDNMRALLFKQPPGPLMELVPSGSTIGLYRATSNEAPAAGYAKFFSEAGYTIALPRFDDEQSLMGFATHSDPFGEGDLEQGAFGLMQPGADATPIAPDVVFLPLLGFTDRGDRIGQGRGHYDRWLASHPEAVAIGMGWDCQLVDQILVEPHDVRLSAIVTPTRFYGPF